VSLESNRRAEQDEKLRRIESVTDAALSLLDVEDLLVELLDRLRDLLDVDTATVLLLDPVSQELVATAARGIEEEVRQGFRLPLGRGFAGRVASERRPISLEKVDRTTVANPILLDKGIRSLLGAPMVANGAVIGVLHVGSLTTRRFTRDDADLLQLVADRIALATQARLSSIERSTAVALQRSLLPAKLPKVVGIDLAARYAPGHDLGVGGDWYDVFTLPTGWLCLVVGDVVGHGLRAAVVMGRLRSVLRAYALESEDPATALTRLDRKIQYFEAGILATAVYAMIAPGGARMHVSLAGHPPPLLAASGRAPAAVTLPVDMPLGISYDEPRRTTSVDLPCGAVVAFYTDGLVERRGELIDVGLKRLADSITADSAEAACAAIMNNLVHDGPTTDDVALLVLRRHGDG
jgi:sigma-B regulation protein RsbU (phosphoserine phosphatase)